MVTSGYYVVEETKIILCFVIFPLGMSESITFLSPALLPGQDSI